MLPPLLVGHIAAWATGGFASVKSHYVYRYQTAFPNTFVKVWIRPTIGGVQRDWVCQDVHYTGAGALQALGGFWIRNVNGAAYPEQEWQNNAMSPARAQLYLDVRGTVPAAAPDKASSMTWQTLMEYVQGLDSLAPPSG